MRSALFNNPNMPREHRRGFRKNGERRIAAAKAILNCYEQVYGISTSDVSASFMSKGECPANVPVGDFSIWMAADTMLMVHATGKRMGRPFTEKFISEFDAAVNGAPIQVRSEGRNQR